MSEIDFENFRELCKVSIGPILYDISIFFLFNSDSRNLLTHLGYCIRKKDTYSHAVWIEK